MKKIRSRGSTRDWRIGPTDGLLLREITAPGIRKRSKKRGTLTITEKIEIVHKVLVGHEKQIDVAKEFRIGVKSVS